MFQDLAKSITNWMTYERPHQEFPLCDFERMRYELRSGDVILVEGRSRVSEVIKQITQSPWSHSCLYIGKLHDIESPELRDKVTQYYEGSPYTELVIEGYLGKGTIVTPLEHYKNDHIRICRPTALARKDAHEVVAYAIRQIGKPYNLRHFIDLGRFLLPWSVLPRRWRSTLFEQYVGEPTKTVCSTMIAEAFASIDYPILPIVKPHDRTGVELFVRNPRLFTPRDFDYSPYFEIIKHPFVSLHDTPYRRLPWNRDGFCTDGHHIAPILRVKDENELPEIETIKIETAIPETEQLHLQSLEAKTNLSFISMVSARVTSLLKRKSI